MNIFTAGWVVQIRWQAYTDCNSVVGKVNHSYVVSSIHSLAFMADVEVLWSCSMQSLCTYGRPQKDMFSCGNIAVLFEVLSLMKRKVVHQV